jgi:hypothetical protein
MKNTFSSDAPVLAEGGGTGWYVETAIAQTGGLNVLCVRRHFEDANKNGGATMKPFNTLCLDLGTVLLCANIAVAAEPKASYPKASSRRSRRVPIPH